MKQPGIPIQMQDLGESIYGLKHRIGCKIYQADIERVLKNHLINADKYCNCDTYDGLRNFRPIETAPTDQLVYVRTETQTQKQLAWKDKAGNWKSKKGAILLRKPTLWKPVK